MGRIIGQVMAMVYLSPVECSLDEIGHQLGLSKAAVSIATRQLESLGLFQQVWKQGDRKNYYKTVDNFARALQHGILEMLRNKLHLAGEELNIAEQFLKEAATNGNSEEVSFLQDRLGRARYLRNRVDKLINNPLIKLIGRR